MSDKFVDSVLEMDGHDDCRFVISSGQILHVGECLKYTTKAIVFKRMVFWRNMYFVLLAFFVFFLVSLVPSRASAADFISYSQTVGGFDDWVGGAWQYFLPDYSPSLVGLYPKSFSVRLTHSMDITCSVYASASNFKSPSDCTLGSEVNCCNSDVVDVLFASGVEREVNFTWSDCPDSPFLSGGSYQGGIRVFPVDSSGDCSAGSQFLQDYGVSSLDYTQNGYGTDVYGVFVTSDSPSSSAVCGDGVISESEACDDGGTVNGDGCDSSCAVEVGYSCAGTPSVCDFVDDSGSSVPVGYLDVGSSSCVSRGVSDSWRVWLDIPADYDFEANPYDYRVQLHIKKQDEYFDFYTFDPLTTPHTFGVVEMSDGSSRAYVDFEKSGDEPIGSYTGGNVSVCWAVGENDVCYSERLKPFVYSAFCVPPVESASCPVGYPWYKFQCWLGEGLWWLFVPSDSSIVGFQESVNTSFSFLDSAQVVGDISVEDIDGYAPDETRAVVGGIEYPSEADLVGSFRSWWAEDSFITNTIVALIWVIVWAVVAVAVVLVVT